MFARVGGSGKNVCQRGWEWLEYLCDWVGFVRVFVWLGGSS